MAPARLIYADSIRDADIYLASGISVVDPFAYIETNGTRVILTSELEADAARRNSTATDVWVESDFGRRELIKQGMNPHESALEVVRRALDRLQLTDVLVPPVVPARPGRLPALSRRHRQHRPGGV